MARKDRPTPGEQPLHAEEATQADPADRTQFTLDPEQEQAFEQILHRPVQDKPRLRELLREQDLIATLSVADLMHAASALALPPRDLAQALAKAQIIHPEDLARLPWQAE